MSGRKIIAGLQDAVEWVRAYPAWICAPCGGQDGSRIPTCATYHADVCGWCGKQAIVTDPRDYGWPPAPQESRS